MAKKIAAPRKTARKAPAAKKASAKKITAPKTHKPSGSPKEKLAYLNKGEMAALSKRKGSGPVRGPKGLPSFVETSGTKSAGSISDSYKKSGGGWNSSSATRSSGKSSGSYNSGTSGSKGGGASTQAPGMGRNEGRVGPSSPMGGQGTSFKTPADARAFQRGQLGIEDQTGRMGPYKGELRNGLSIDKDGNFFNPNNPERSISQRFDEWDQVRANDDRFYRETAKANLGPQTNPREMREYVSRMNAMANNARAKMDAENIRNGKGDPTYNGRLARDSIRTPDVRVGAASRGFAGGKENYGGGYRAGGVVKSRKTFKKK